MTKKSKKKAAPEPETEQPDIREDESPDSVGGQDSGLMEAAAELATGDVSDDGAPDSGGSDESVSVDVDNLMVAVNALREDLETTRVDVAYLKAEMGTLKVDLNMVPRAEPAEERDGGLTGDGAEYVVQKGDTLAMIAKRFLSNAGRFNEIAVLNYEEHPELRGSTAIKEGWVLKMPRSR